MNVKYYWHCPVCKTKLKYSKSLAGARESLEHHESKQHKGKRVGNFGLRRCYGFVYRDKQTDKLSLVVKSRKNPKTRQYYSQYTIENKWIRKIRFRQAYIDKWLVRVF